MINYIWKLYYSRKLGKEGLQKALSSAKLLTNSTIESTNGTLGHFYDESGQQIRGWHRKNYNFPRVQHPLITKYDQ